MITEQVAPSQITVAVRDARLCAACEHETERHDAIGTRFCEATQAQALARNCICKPA